MIKLLAKIFIKEKEQSPAKVRSLYGIICGAVGIFINLLLFGFKFFVGTISNSVAICADAFNNLSDAGSSVLTLLGFKLANRQPDPKHPFGHGRFEYLSGLLVSIFIILMGVELAQTSIKKIIQPEPTEFSLWVIVILSCSILLKIYMFVYNTRIAKKIDSGAMKAVAKDSLGDSLATLVVLLSAIFVHFTGINIDGYVGTLVSLLIFYAGVSSTIETITPLLGKAPAPEFVNEIKKIVLQNKSVVGLHDLIVHDYGPGRVLISLHAEVPADKNILEIHDDIDLLEMELAEKLNCEAVIHMDPLDLNDQKTNSLKKEINSLLKEIDSSLSLHDFRLVSGPTHTNILFDIVLPFNFSLSKNEVNDLMIAKIKNLDNSYYPVINFDHDYLG